jgi:hypothetical protein
MISDKYISILACPACLGELVLTDAGNSLRCLPCALSYQIRDGIPVMLLEQAEKNQDPEPEDNIL